MPMMWRAAVLALLAGGCNQVFGLSKTAVVDGAIGGSCGSGDLCLAPSVCDTTSNLCVQCTATQADACTAGSPVCGSDDVCHPCTAHADCPSDVCLPDGSCAAAVEVSYVAPTGTDPVGATDAPCSQAAPCATVAGALLSKELRPTIKVRGSISKSTTIPAGAALTIIGDADAELHADVGPAITVLGSAVLTLRDLVIASGSSGIEVSSANTSATVNLLHCQIRNNSGIGINVTGPSAGPQPTLTVAQSKIESNNGGGIYVTNGIVDLVGNVFFGNGNMMTVAGFGGLRLDTVSANSRVAFNTFASNLTKAFPPAIRCSSLDLTLSNNVAADNVQAGAGSAQVDDVNLCTYTYTLVFPGPVPNGATNMGGDPMFTDLVHGDLHIVNDQSPAWSAADPNADLSGLAADDPDGHARVRPADVGAFQHLN